MIIVFYKHFRRYFMKDKLEDVIELTRLHDIIRRQEKEAKGANALLWVLAILGAIAAIAAIAFFVYRYMSPAYSDDYDDDDFYDDFDDDFADDIDLGADTV